MTVQVAIIVMSNEVLVTRMVTVIFIVIVSVILTENVYMAATGAVLVTVMVMSDDCTVDFIGDCYV